MGKIKIAMISRWFVHARKFANLANSYEESEVVAVWDYLEDRGKQFAKELGCRFESDYNALLEDKEINAFIVMVPVSMHAEFIVKALNAGKHVFTEKPLSVSLEGGYAIQDAVKKNSNLHFMMSDPVVKPPMLYIRKMLDDGLLGKVSSVRIRISSTANISEPDEWALSHTAAEMGGGDLIDLGHHTIHVLEWLLGKPRSVTAMFGHVSEKAKRENFEDNAVAVFQFENGVLGIAETASVSFGSDYELGIYGSKGCIHSTRTHVRYCLEEGNWVDVPDTDLPTGYGYVLHYWILGIANHEMNREYGVDCSVRCLEMVQAAYRSEGKETAITYREDEARD